MSEFNFVSNKEIRQKARALLKANFGRIFGLGLLMTVISMAPSLMMEMMTSVLVTSDLALFLYYVVNIAVFVLSMGLTVGFYQVCRNVWNGEPAGVGTLFSKFKRIPRMLGISFIMGALITVAYIPLLLVLMIGAFMSEVISGIAIALMVLVVVAIFIAIIWAELRFSLAHYCIVVRPELGIFECLRASWIATKGKVWRVFCHVFWMALPATIAMILSMIPILLMTVIFSGMSAEILLIVEMLVIMLTAAAMQGYVSLGQYGLAEYLLNGAETGVPVLYNYGVWPAPGGHFEDFQPEPIALPGEVEKDEDEHNPDTPANE